MRIAINTCWGGFGLSHEATLKLAERKGIKLYWYEEHGLKHYTTIPVEEFQALHKQAETTRDFTKVNSAYYSPDYSRADPDLLAVIDDMGDTADGQHAKIKIIEIPDGVDWEIDEYDGQESVAEKHRSWR